MLSAILLIIASSQMSDAVPQVTLYPANSTIPMATCRGMATAINNERVRGVKASCIPQKSE